MWRVRQAVSEPFRIIRWLFSIVGAKEASPMTHSFCLVEHISEQILMCVKILTNVLDPNE